MEGGSAQRGRAATFEVLMPPPAVLFGGPFGTAADGTIVATACP